MKKKREGEKEREGGRAFQGEYIHFVCGLQPFAASCSLEIMLNDNDRKQTAEKKVIPFLDRGFVFHLRDFLCGQMRKKIIICQQRKRRIACMLTTTIHTQRREQQKKLTCVNTQQLIIWTINPLFLRHSYPDRRGTTGKEEDGKKHMEP